MKYLMERLGGAALLVALLCGCGKNLPKPSVDPRAFDAAAPEIKQFWDEALAASAANDPGSAISSLRLLSRQNISPEQRQAAQNALAVYEAKLREDAKRGDPAASKAMEVLGISSATTKH